MRLLSSILAAGLAVLLGFPASAASPEQKPVSTTTAAKRPVLSRQIRQMLDTISADSLRGNLSFLSSDTLEGRYTPSPGLDIAAEFIAGQFRKAGLEPGGDERYFQIARMVQRRTREITSALTIDASGEPLRIRPADVQVYRANRAAKIDGSRVIKLASQDPALLKDLDVTNAVIFAPQPDFRNLSDEQRQDLSRKSRLFAEAVAKSGAAAFVVVMFSSPGQRQRSQLIFHEEAVAQTPPVLRIYGDAASGWFRNLKAGVTESKVSVQIPEPEDHEVKLKNVVGILRGSDPKLKETCVMLTAHYDHIGTLDTAGLAANSQAPSRPGDRIYNGANDDGSGTVSVIEIASSLAKLKPRPKRSIVFVAFFGEELGGYGSRYYAAHPLFPISQTVADVNLEQVGRTDSSKGRQLANASLTGYDYSDVTKFLERAGRVTGVKVYKDAEGSDAFFTRSDNVFLAMQGVPAHSLTVAFEFSDYHGLADEWPKIDYENMAKVNRMVALGLVNMANSRVAPQWNAKNPKTERFRTAQAKQGQSATAVNH